MCLSNSKLVNSTVGIPVDPQTRCFAGVVRVLAIQKGSQTSRQLLTLCHLGIVPYAPHHPALETTHGYKGKMAVKTAKLHGCGLQSMHLSTSVYFMWLN